MVPETSIALGRGSVRRVVQDRCHRPNVGDEKHFSKVMLKTADDNDEAP